ncbi:MAG: hypothetical protein AB7D57_11145 [Desulfovibrionaceae bacterium]
MPNKLTLAEAARRVGPPQITRLAAMVELLPPLIARGDVDKWTGGIRSRSALARDDQIGAGPRVRVMIGQKVAYPREYLVEYLERLPNGKGEPQEVNVIVQPGL